MRTEWVSVYRCSVYKKVNDSEFINHDVSNDKKSTPYVVHKIGRIVINELSVLHFW